MLSLYNCLKFANLDLSLENKIEVNRIANKN